MVNSGVCILAEASWRPDVQTSAADIELRPFAATAVLLHGHRRWHARLAAANGVGDKKIALLGIGRAMLVKCLAGQRSRSRYDRHFAFDCFFEGLRPPLEKRTFHFIASLAARRRPDAGAPAALSSAHRYMFLLELIISSLAFHHRPFSPPKPKLASIRRAALLRRYLHKSMP